MHEYLRSKSMKTQAIFWILICKFSFVVMMVIVKAQSSYPTLQLNFLRSLLVMVAVAPLLLRHGMKGFQTKKPGNQLYRVVFGMAAMICMFYAYRVLTLSKASALEFSYGLVLPVMAMFFLKEKIQTNRWFSLILGYVGVWLIIDPVYERLEFGELIMLISVLLKSASSIHLKKLTDTDAPLLSVFYSGLATVTCLGIYFLAIPYFPAAQNLFWAAWHPVNVEGAWWILLMGVCSFIAQYSYIQAFRRGQLNFLSGFEYLKIIFSTIFGILIFAQTPSWQTIMGGFIILVSSYFIARKEVKESVEI
ncbi:MAG: DMT family transporter [Alphaproteobacteria bacterium]